LPRKEGTTNERRRRDRDPTISTTKENTMTITETTVDPYTGDDGTDDEARTSYTARAAFLAGLRHGRYPVVPEALSVAVRAMEHADELSDEVRRSKPLGMAVFCRQVAADALAGKPYPTRLRRGGLRRPAGCGEAQRAVDRGGDGAPGTARPVRRGDHRVPA